MTHGGPIARADDVAGSRGVWCDAPRASASQLGAVYPESEGPCQPGAHRAPPSCGMRVLPTAWAQGPRQHRPCAQPGWGRATRLSQGAIRRMSRPMKVLSDNLCHTRQAPFAYESGAADCIANGEGGARAIHDDLRGTGRRGGEERHHQRPRRVPRAHASPRQASWFPEEDVPQREKRCSTAFGRNQFSSFRIWF